MATLNIEKIKAQLKQKNVDDATIDTVERVIKDNLPPEILNKALIFLGIVTIALALGFILLVALNKTVPGEGWTALAAGIGGLAGIFAAK